MLINRWFSLGAATWLEFSAGLVYTFSIFSGSIKAANGYSQVQLQGLGAAVVSGGLAAWIPGLTYDRLLQRHLKLAPRLAAGVGCSLLSLGYLAIWANARHYLNLPYWLVLVCGALSSHGIVWLDAGSLITSCHNFRAFEGSIAGILKSYLGLSASVATSIYIAIFKPHELEFLFFVAVAPLVVGTLAIPFLNYVPRKELSNSISILGPARRLNLACGILVALILYQGVSVLIDRTYHPRRVISHLQMWGALLLAALASSVLLIRNGGLRSKKAAVPEDVEAYSDRSADSVQPRQGTPKSQGSLQEGLLAAEATDEREASAVEAAHPHEPSLAQCLVTLDYWLLSSSFFVIMGAGFTLLNNMGQIVEALGGSSPDIYVLCFTTLNCLGRLACGFLSEYALHRYGVLRTVFPIYLAAGTSAVAFAVAFTSHQLLLPLAAVGGLLFGAQWPLMPALTMEAFGAKHLCANQSVPQAATALGALLLANQLAGRIYQKHVPPAEPACYGRYCFRATFIIIGLLAAVQVAISWLFWWRTRSQTRRNTQAYMSR